MLVPCYKDHALHHYDDESQKKECPHHAFRETAIVSHVANTKAARIAHALGSGTSLRERARTSGTDPLPVAPPSDD